jgi:methylmalonyl-CoA carboxyltransferase 5S subunit
MGRYKVMTGEFADLMLGYYGECLGERNVDVVELAKAQAKKEPITVRPADLLQPEWDQLTESAALLEGFDGSEEDVLTNAMFPGVAPKFFASRAEGPKNVGKTPAQLAAEAAKAAGNLPGIQVPVNYNVTIGGKAHSVTVEPV